MDPNTNPTPHSENAHLFVSQAVQENTFEILVAELRTPSEDGCSGQRHFSSHGKVTSGLDSGPATVFSNFAKWGVGLCRQLILLLGMVYRRRNTMLVKKLLQVSAA